MIAIAVLSRNYQPRYYQLRHSPVLQPCHGQKPLQELGIKALYPEMHRSKYSRRTMGEISNQYYFFLNVVLSSTKCSENLTVDSEPSVSRRSPKMILSKRTTYGNFGKSSFDSFDSQMFSDKSGHYKSFALRKLLIPDIF